MNLKRALAMCGLLTLLIISQTCAFDGEDLENVAVEGQPLAANVKRLLDALEFLGAPLPDETNAALRAAAKQRDASKLQQLIDPNVLLVVSLNPESRVKVERGPATATLQQAGHTPHLVKIVNNSTVTKQLRINSPQAGAVYAGVADLSMQRQQQTELTDNENARGDTDRFLSLEMFQTPPMTAILSGLEVEYAIALICSNEAGKREAVISFDVGQGTEDIGFRGETPVLFDVLPAAQVALSIKDHDGQPTVARLMIRDQFGRVYPPQPKRLAPDFFFQPHVYRADGETVLLPRRGQFQVEYSRGPEYRVRHMQFTMAESPAEETELKLELRRWINPMERGFYCGDHHIHAAGCSHYTSPTEGVRPEDMFRQIKGEGLNVGCVLTWGPCFDFQRQFFAPGTHDISERRTVLKYDLEISGFGSQALGHVCLLNLKDQTYPGSEGTSTKGWPTWTTPVLRWAKEQGAVTGYAHSASGLAINPQLAARRLIDLLDADRDDAIGRAESEVGLLPEPFDVIDEDRNGQLAVRELTASNDRAADRLPNLAIPEMNGVGAMEICVSAAEGVCDFISAMDTPRIAEWNMWYHLLNCGLPIKVSGETDFPCMSSRHVGQGRVYVQLGEAERVDFTAWCENLRRGRSYVSDGYAHALDFSVNANKPGEGDVALDRPGKVTVAATVAFAPEIPRAVAHGSQETAEGRRLSGDTVLLHAERNEDTIKGGTRLVEVVVNGKVIDSQRIPADGASHDLRFTFPIDRSSWIAIRQFPQLHTNPVNVIVADKPIRASRNSARWCIETIDQLWRSRGNSIARHERAEARATFTRAIEFYRQIAADAQE